MSSTTVHPAANGGDFRGRTRSFTTLLRSAAKRPTCKR